MKKTIITSIIAAALSFNFSSCTKDLTALNVDEKNATVAGAETFFANAQKGISDELGSSGYTASGTGAAKMFVQHLTSVTYLEGVTYIKAFSWDGLYANILKDLEESSKVLNASNAQTPAEQVSKKNKLAMVEIMKVYVWSILVESYGDLPYSEALDFENVLPKYDDDKAVYLDLIKRLGTATDNIEVTGGGFGSSDLFYAGNAGLWKKFGNSLRLKMGMRIMDADATTGTATIAAALTGGVFTSNADNALFKYLPEPPNTNPWWSHLVNSNLRYFVGTTPFVDYMNATNDPRRAAYLTPISGGTYKGAPSGAVVDYLAYSYLGPRFRVPTLANIIMDYASVEFLLAEAAERNVAGVTNAAGHYNAAIKASFDYYGVSGIDAFLAQPNVAYATAPGTWKEKIAMQKWVALFEQGFEAWTEYRRLDYPVLTPPAAATSPVVPRRFIYPITEQTLNGANYKAAAAAIGGDEYTTKLFWDVN